MLEAIFGKSRIWCLTSKRKDTPFKDLLWKEITNQKAILDKEFVKILLEKGVCRRSVLLKKKQKVFSNY